MKVTYDIHFSPDGTPLGVHYIDIDSTLPKDCTVEAGAQPTLNSYDVIVIMRDNPDKRKAAGFMELTNIPNQAAGATRWDMIVAACNANNATAEMKALGLK